MSYNSRGLRVGQGHAAADKARRLVVDTLFDNCDILCIQETWMAKQDLDKLNTLHPDFHGADESTTDLSTTIVRGRIARGVAILWNTKYDSMVLHLNVDWAIGLEFNCNGNNFIILNIYTPFESYDHVDEFVSRLALYNPFSRIMTHLAFMFWVIIMQTCRLISLCLLNICNIK